MVSFEGRNLSSYYFNLDSDLIDHSENLFQDSMELEEDYKNQQPQMPTELLDDLGSNNMINGSYLQIRNSEKISNEQIKYT